jgi:hypothetical protein
MRSKNYGKNSRSETSVYLVLCTLGIVAAKYVSQQE